MERAEGCRASREGTQKRVLRLCPRAQFIAPLRITWRDGESKKRSVDPLLYNRTMQNDTIAAIATPSGVGGIGVVRVSGMDAFPLVQPLFRQPGGRTDLPLSHLLTFG